MIFETERGSRAHDVLVDAMLDGGGFVLIGDELHEILGVVYADDAVFQWAARAVRHAGTA